MYDVNTNKHIGYIYLVTNTINNKKYIGQTIQKPSYRFKQHCQCAMDDKPDFNMLLPRAINKYGVENFKMDILYEFKENSKEELKEILNITEIECISKYHTLSNENGYNITKGGNFVSDLSYKPVDQYSLDGEFIKTWDSMSDAAYILDGDRTKSPWIGRVCAGKRGGVTAFGYVWRYHGDLFEKYGLSIYEKIPIDVYDIHGNFIASFNSFDGALILDDLDNGDIYEFHKAIKRCCTGHDKVCHYKGYVFRYKGEPFEKYEVNISHFKNVRVNKYTKDGIFIDNFENCNDAANSIDNNNKRIVAEKISSCTKHQKNRITAYGFRWYRETDLSQPDKSRIRTRLNQENPKAIEYINNQRMSKAS